jgi:hypothetical protein
MGIGNGVSRFSVRETGPAGHCALCATARQAADRSSTGAADTVGSGDQDVCVVSGPALGGLLVVPCSHVSGLEELSIPQRAKVLAAVRRATLSVRNENPWSEPRIVVRTDLPASEGHMCLEVLPCFPDTARDSSSRSGRGRFGAAEDHGRPAGLDERDRQPAARTINGQQVSESRPKVSTDRQRRSH